MQAKLVIFDYDDTIVKSSEYFYQLEVQVSNNLGFTNITRDLYFSLWGKPHEDMVKIMHPEIDVQKYMKEYNRIYNPNNLVLFDGAKEVIEYLHNKGIQLAILSAKKIDKLEEHTKHLGIRDFFQYIHGAESSEFKKPDPRVFDDILAFFGNCDKSEIVYIGDQTSDYKASSQAGIKFIGIVSGINTREDFEKIGYFNPIEGIIEIKDIF